MTSKRMTSVSVSDLHDSVSNLSLHSESSAKKHPRTFESRYIQLQEIGRGGFSYVYKCQDRVSGQIYAVKIVDLRPLRLRDNFDPNRLRREADIMKHLKHPNIVQFIEFFETPDEFYMVLEFCPGKELFDVILSKQSLSETDARPIFYQIADAMRYLHSLNIMHRDIKPENILVLDAVDPNTGVPRIKLLDFGLSKNAGNGSAGRSFVGTPCYLAPEVEMTSNGQGGVYGLAADCWSLGALLHVMLVARFPEFERDRRKGTITLVLPSKHWSEISVQAKDLVKGLMETNSFARLTIKEVVAHPWLGLYQSDASEPVPRPPIVSSPRGSFDVDSTGSAGSSGVREFVQLYSINDNVVMNLNEELAEDTPPSAAVQVVIKTSPRGVGPAAVGSATVGPGGVQHEDNTLSLGPLLNLQRSIALCFEDALASYVDYPEVATQIHRGAVMCRKQLMDSTKMLRKVEQTASSVLELFPDLELAVEEGAPELAAEFFSVVRTWVAELREMVNSTQMANHESMLQIHTIIRESTTGLSKKEASQAAADVDWKGKVDATTVLENIKAMQSRAGKSGGLTADQIFELFMGLFDQSSKEQSPDDQSAMTVDGETESEVRGEGYERKDSVSESIYTPAVTLGEPRSDSITESVDTGLEFDRRSTADTIDELTLQVNAFNQVAVVGTSAVSKYEQSPSAAKLLEALHKLRQVDIILEQLGVFWANTEVVLDVLSKKGQHAEQFVAYANKPRLLTRFKERLAEYSKFWMGVRDMCSSYVSNVQPQTDAKVRLYEFLEKNSSRETVSSMSEHMFANTPGKRTASPAVVEVSPDRFPRVQSNDRFDKVDSI